MTLWSGMSWNGRHLKQEDRLGSCLIRKVNRTLTVAEGIEGGPEMGDIPDRLGNIKAL